MQQDHSELPCAMVVEREPYQQAVYSHAVMELGFQILPATCPHQARVHLASGKRIDVLLAEIRGPDMDGLDIAKRAIAANPGIAVVAMTTFRPALVAAEELGIPVLHKSNGHVGVLALLESELAGKVVSLENSHGPRWTAS